MVHQNRYPNYIAYKEAKDGEVYAGPTIAYLGWNQKATKTRLHAEERGRGCRGEKYAQFPILSIHFY